jgi:hypothetical protein
MDNEFIVSVFFCIFLDTYTDRIFSGYLKRIYIYEYGYILDIK